MSADNPAGVGNGARVRISVLRLKPWQIWLGGGLAAALGLGLALLATGILLIAVPAALVAGAIWRLTRRGSGAAPPPPGVIDAEYRIIDRRSLPPSDG